MGDEENKLISQCLIDLRELGLGDPQIEYLNQTLEMLLDLDENVDLVTVIASIKLYIDKTKDYTSPVVDLLELNLKELGESDVLIYKSKLYALAACRIMPDKRGRVNSDRILTPLTVASNLDEASNPDSDVGLTDPPVLTAGSGAILSQAAKGLVRMLPQGKRPCNYAYVNRRGLIGYPARKLFEIVGQLEDQEELNAFEDLNNLGNALSDIGYEITVGEETHDLPEGYATVVPETTEP